MDEPRGIKAIPQQWLLRLFLVFCHFKSPCRSILVYTPFCICRSMSAEEILRSEVAGKSMCVYVCDIGRHYKYPFKELVTIYTNTLNE